MSPNYTPYIVVGVILAIIAAIGIAALVVPSRRSKKGGAKGTSVLTVATEPRGEAERPPNSQAPP
ncbi:MAG: hypothetical protein ABSA63_09700 [Thermoplasmata archaeon]|jgi:hypothetical protein